MRVLGLSSGTSHDGIDAALVAFDAEGEVLRARLLRHTTTAYSPQLRTAIRAALPPHTVGLGDVCRLDTRIGQEFAEVAAGFADVADLVCSHGQTLYHWVDDGTVKGTLQLGQPAWIAERTGLPVVSDVRARDVAAGGQGAPLVAVLDRLLLAGHADLGTAGALNIGGIANLTVPSVPVAYDTGPGNALIDAAALTLTGRPYDADGALAATGTVDRMLLDRLLAEPYYGQPPPKSTGKELFHTGYLDGLIDGLSPTDVLATLTELTAVTVAAEALRYKLDTVVVSGGGAHNAFLMRRLADAVRPARLTTSDALGVPGDAKEAVLFALIGWLTAHGLPGVLAACTGARTATVLGAVTGRLAPRTATMPARLVMI
ncbi:MAG: anhydro-N-acetylmuramic acid kinase [Hamadaea sp.]|nr:anhydro-N-acetylmuramic acid kinase [Hamadaea sp.]